MAEAGVPGSRADLEAVKPGVDLPFRICDFLACKLAAIELPRASCTGRRIAATAPWKLARPI